MCLRCVEVTPIRTGSTYLTRYTHININNKKAMLFRRLKQLLMTINGCSWWSLVCWAALCQPHSRVCSCTRAMCLVISRNQHDDTDTWHTILCPWPLEKGRLEPFCYAVRRHTSTETHLETYTQISKTHKYPFNQFLCSGAAEKRTKM